MILHQWSDSRTAGKISSRSLPPTRSEADSPPPPTMNSQAAADASGSGRPRHWSANKLSIVEIISSDLPDR